MLTYYVQRKCMGSYVVFLLRPYEVPSISVWRLIGGIWNPLNICMKAYWGHMKSHQYLYEGLFKAYDIPPISPLRLIRGIWSPLNIRMKAYLSIWCPLNISMKVYWGHMKSPQYPHEGLLGAYEVLSIYVWRLIGGIWSPLNIRMKAYWGIWSPPNIRMKAFWGHMKSPPPNIHMKAYWGHMKFPQYMYEGLLGAYEVLSISAWRLIRGIWSYLNIRMKAYWGLLLQWYSNK